MNLAGQLKVGQHLDSLLYYCYSIFMTDISSIRILWVPKASAQIYPSRARAVISRARALTAHYKAFPL